MNAVIVVEEAMLERVIMRVLANAGILKGNAPSEETATEVNTRKAKKLLAGKGYHVISTAAFNRLMDDHNIKGERKGKENWYSVAKLEKIPARV